MITECMKSINTEMEEKQNMGNRLLTGQKQIVGNRAICNNGPDSFSKSGVIGVAQQGS